MKHNKTLRIALIAGEVSGDILGASLMQAFKMYKTISIEFIGVGGSRMKKEGLNSYFSIETLSVLGLTEILFRLPALLYKRQYVIRKLLNYKPDVMIGIDSPDFTIEIEYQLRKYGIKTVHYVSPSIWAWRKTRIKKIMKSCDLMLTLFPFETELYEKHGIPVYYVGHPLADDIPFNINKKHSKEFFKINNNTKIIAIMPGSRKIEIEKLGPLFFETAQKVFIKRDNIIRDNIIFIIPYANKQCRDIIEKILYKYKFPFKLLDGSSNKFFSACDVVLTASGTATLEALLYKIPMVVAYKMSSLTYVILKLLVKTPYISLPNLLARKKIVPEFIQEQANPRILTQNVLSLLNNGSEQTIHFNKIHHKLRKSASTRAAQAILKLIYTTYYSLLLEKKNNIFL